MSQFIKLNEALPSMHSHTAMLVLSNTEGIYTGTYYRDLYILVYMVLDV